MRASRRSNDACPPFLLQPAGELGVRVFDAEFAGRAAAGMDTGGGQRRDRALLAGPSEGLLARVFGEIPTGCM